MADSSRGRTWRAVGGVLVAAFAAGCLLGAAQPARGDSPCLTLVEFDDRCERWVSVEDDSTVQGGPYQFPAAMARSVDGGTVFVAASERAEDNPFQSPSSWLLLALDAETGQRLWTARPAGLDRFSAPLDLTVADGRLVVTGSGRPSFGSPDSRVITVALETATGEEIWRSSWDPSPGRTDVGKRIAAPPDGAMIYVGALTTPDAQGDLDYGIIAYDAATGAQRWAAVHRGLEEGESDVLDDIAASPDGSLLYATGSMAGPGEFNIDYGTLALHTGGADAGELAWQARYDGVGNRAPDDAAAITVSPDGSRVYVTGHSDDVPGGPPFAVNYGFATLGYDARTGEQLWETRTHWPDKGFAAPQAMAVSPDGGRVFVVGQASGGGDSDMATVAYDATSGEALWSDRIGLAEHDGEYALATAASSDHVYVTGHSASGHTATLFLGQGYLGYQQTVAYRFDGTRAWTARLNGTAPQDRASGHDIAVGPDGHGVYTLGQLTHNVEPGGDFYDLIVAAYDG